jgi:(p)ppGpp synthase/HD superfamily hydrolase
VSSGDDAGGIITEAMTDITLVLRAASFVAHKHRNQRRKDATASPYINHPLALVRVLAEQQRKWLKRRQAIELAIGHAKSDDRMDRC